MREPPDCLVRLNWHTYSFVRLDPGPILFLGAMRLPDGQMRLVEVHGTLAPNNVPSEAGLSYLIYTPGGLTSDPKVTGAGIDPTSSGNIPAAIDHPASRVEIDFGVIRSDNNSMFTIPFTVDGRRGEIVCRLIAGTKEYAEMIESEIRLVKN